MRIFLWILGSIFTITLLSLSPIIAYNTDTYVVATVDKSERVASSESAQYLIFTDSEVFTNSDSLWYWKWNSSDFYNDIKEGKTYSFRVCGFRIPFLSLYRNIIEFEPVE